MSEVAGRMSVQVGAQYLEKPNGGRGIPARRRPWCGPPPTVVILGGGIGRHQRCEDGASGLGAHVTIIDRSLKPAFRELDDIFQRQTSSTPRLQRLDHRRETSRPADPRGGRCPHPRRLPLPKPGAPRNDRHHEARFRRRGRRHRPGRLLRKPPTPPPTPTPSTLSTACCTIACRICPLAVPHTSTMALTNATFPVPAGTGEPRSGKMPASRHPALRDGVKHLQRLCHPQRCRRIARPASGAGLATVE